MRGNVVDTVNCGVYPLRNDGGVRLQLGIMTGSQDLSLTPCQRASRSCSFPYFWYNTTAYYTYTIWCAETKLRTHRGDVPSPLILMLALGLSLKANQCCCFIWKTYSHMATVVKKAFERQL